MKVNVLSDLHLDFSPLALPGNDADVVVLAGDIARPREAIAWASRLDRPVLYVPGNHEFYGGTLAGTVDELKRLSVGTGVRVLDDEEVLLGDVRFLGSTLWTDFMLFGGGDARAAAMREAQRFMRDFSRIRIGQAPFTPEASAQRFTHHAAWLGRKLAERHPGPTVVITHHAPSPRSIHPRFANSPLNACFVSEAEDLMDGARVCLWIHGHTHDSFDYFVKGTRVLCNPRGYARDGTNENPRFDVNLVATVGTPHVA
ncbi:MAG TPA: metallophosphoesterase [Usitatibacter sp.]|nr:metallophosphoesterase [Usitatibacter sp.]